MDKKFTMRNTFIGLCVLIYGCTNGDVYIEKGKGMEKTIGFGKNFFINRKENIIRNNIVVYRLNGEKPGQYFQTSGRVIGLPGDVIQIKKGTIYVNDKVFLLPPTAIFHYKVSLKYTDDDIMKDMNIEGEDLGFYNSFLTEDDSIRVSQKYKNVIMYMRRTYLEGFNQKTMLNGQNRFGWTQDDFGPVKIPYQKKQIDLDSARIFFNKLDTASIMREKYFVDQNFYFVICDNFHDGLDSRDWGLLSEKQIIGTIKHNKKDD